MPNKYVILKPAVIITADFNITEITDTIYAAR